MTETPKNESMMNAMIRVLRVIFDRGMSLLAGVEATIKKTPLDKLTDGEREVAQLGLRELNRRYIGSEAAELVGVSLSAIYQAEKDGRLHKPDVKKDSGGIRKVRSGYTLEQINHMRDVFGTRRPRPPRAITLGVLNLKGGSWKTTVSWLLGQYLAMQGYRVLYIDTDPQGSLSFLMGCRPDIDTTFADTIGPFMLRYDDDIIEVGGDPNSLRYAIRPTHWPQVDIIPACLELLQVDLLLPGALSKLKQNQVENWKPAYVERLRSGIESVQQDYDFVIIDGTPSLNLSTINVVTACDVTLVPVPAQMSDFASTLQFSRLIIEQTEAIGGNGYFPPVPEVFFVITKFAAAHYANWMAKVIRAAFEDRVLRNELRKHDEIGRAGTRITSIFETNPRDAVNRKSLKKATENYSDVFEELLTSVIYPMFENGAEEDMESLSATLHKEGVLK